MKIAVYAIAKNEEENVQRWLNTVKDADGIFVLDTGSTDRTVELLEAGGAVVSIRSPDRMFRFDNARNESLDAVPLDYDLCISLDFDEILVDGWREHLENFEGKVANYNLIFSFDRNGNVTCSYPRMAIHRRLGFYWKYPAHEVLTSHTQHEVSSLPITVVHLPSAPKPAGHYLDLLRLSVEENPNDARAIQYLARELMYCKQYATSISLFARHATIEQHAQFRAESFRFMAAMSFELGKLEECERYYFRAISEFLDAREPYCELAFLYFQTGEFESCIGTLRSALRIESKPDVPMVFKDEYYGYWPYHLLAAAYFNLGFRDSGVAALQLAVEQCDGELPEALLTDLLRVGLNVYINSPSAATNDEVEQGGIPSSIETETEEVSRSISEVEPQASHSEAGIEHQES